MALRTVFCIMLCTLTSGLLGRAIAGPAVETNDARIERLYGEAKDAESSGNFAGAISKYQEILKLAPRLAAAYNNLGALYVKHGDYRDAVDTLERGLKVDPSMRSASALLGMSLLNLGEYEKARRPLEAAVKANPADANAELLLVDDLTKLSDFPAAANHLQALARNHPENQQVWYLLGKVYLQLSEQALAKVNEIDPDSVWAHEISAELMESMKNYEGAIVEWKKAEEAAPRQPGVHYKLGDLYWSLSQWDNASEQFEQERTIDPRNCLVEWKLGDILLQKSQDPDKALSHVDAALQACPNLAEAHADRGRLLLKIHREQEALADLQFAERANPAEPSNHFLLAQVYRATGKAQEAAAEMKQFSELEQKARAATAQRAEDVIKNSQPAH